MSKPDLQAIPAAACTFEATQFHLGDNGEDAKTAPVRLLARSSKPIEHWYWGNVVHDTDGYNLNGRNRIPIDFNHDTGEAIGYINKFESTPEGLVLSGTLVSHFEGDRADRIMRDQRAGIPYESSINFGGDGIKVEMIGEGETALINGVEMAGPLTRIAEYPLRGVALCLYGADGNTTAKVFKDGGTFVASEVTPKQEDGDMSTPEELSAEAVEAVEAVSEAAEVATTEEVVDETTELSQETVEVVEAEADEAVDADAAEVEEEEQDAQFSASEFTRIVTAFGAEVAAEVVANGGNYTDALQLAFEKQAEELAEAKAAIAELSANPRTASQAVAFADGESAKNKRVSFAQHLQSKFDEVK